MSNRKALLVLGNIPAQKPCPFIGKCNLFNERCPTPIKLKQGEYSCAAARMHDLFQGRAE